MGKVTTNLGIPAFGEIVKLLDKQKVIQVAEKLKANRYTKRHSDSDLGKYDSLVADAGHQKTGEAEVAPVQHDDCRTYSTQFLHGTIRFSQPAKGAMDKNH